MGPTQWLPISLSQLELGLPLRYDIYTEGGDHLANAGDEFSQSIKASWLQLGLSTVCAKIEVEHDDDSLTKPHSLEVMRSIEDNLEMAGEIVFEIAARTSGKHAVTSMEFNEITTRIVSDIQSDNAAALTILAQSLGKQNNDQSRALADRSAQLSLLCMLVACESGLVPAECQIVGTAAMLHDISLMGFDLDQDPDEASEKYQQHPIHSANMVDSIVGLNPKVAMAIAQVHESPRGDGFPRGLHANRIIPAARIINLGDTFLTLTLQQQPPPLKPACNYHPADALGYLMYHAAHGQFEPEFIQALIRSASLYPVGSGVVLSDDSTAVVFRSTRIAPSRPIVRLNETEQLLDLRSSTLGIRGPDRRQKSNDVLQKSKLGEVIWG